MAPWHVCLHRLSRQTENVQKRCFVLAGACLAVLMFTPPFTSSRGSPTPGALLSSLGDPCSLQVLQSTPLLLLPLTEMPQEFVLASGLCNLVPSTSLGTCMSGDLYPFVHLVFFFPVNLPGSGVGFDSDIHACYSQGRRPHRDPCVLMGGCHHLFQLFHNTTEWDLL